MQTSGRISKYGRLSLDVAIESRARLHTYLGGKRFVRTRAMLLMLVYFQCHTPYCLAVCESRSTVNRVLGSEIVRYAIFAYTAVC